MPITKGFRALVDEAMAQVTTYSVAEVQARLQDPSGTDRRHPRHPRTERRHCSWRIPRAARHAGVLGGP